MIRPISWFLESVIGKPWKSKVVKPFKICWTVDIKGKKVGLGVIIYSAVIFKLHYGTFSMRKGIFLKRTDPTYRDLLKIRPMPNDTNKANIIGRNSPTFSVVSSIITANENDKRVYPASIAADPIIA